MNRLFPLAYLLARAVPAVSASLRAGAAETVITPPVGAPMAGYYANRAATGTHDDLHAKALVLESEGVEVAFVVCDVVSLPREISEQARKIVTQKTGIPEDHVMISANHTHTGPVILTYPSRYNLTGEMKRIAEEYTAQLPGRIADSVIAAAAKLQPAQMRSAVGREDSLGFNRRYFMNDGTIGWNPGKLNPKIVRPAGPTDPGVPVIYVETPDEKPIAAYVNFAVHQDTTGGLQFSADYSYTLSKVLMAAKGPELVTLFTIGCAGNVNHIDVTRKERQTSYEEAARIGGVLAGEVLKTIQHASVVSNPHIRISREILRLKVPELTRDEIEWAHRTQETAGSAKPAPFMDLVRAGRDIKLESRHGEPFEAEVQVVAIGGQLAIVGLPGEMFVELGLALKQDSPFRITIRTELANGALSYIPNQQAYPQGAYEVAASWLEPGGGEALVRSALGQLDKLFAAQRQ
jgi:neutral ceramidase